AVDLSGVDAEVLNRAVGDRIGVAAVRRERQAAEIAGRPRYAGLEEGLVLIHIGNRDRAARNEVAVDDIGVLGHVGNRRIADHRRVVGAVDGDGDELAGAAVAGDRRERVGNRLAGAELLDRALA